MCQLQAQEAGVSYYSYDDSRKMCQWSDTCYWDDSASNPWTIFFFLDPGMSRPDHSQQIHSIKISIHVVTARQIKTAVEVKTKCADALVTQKRTGRMSATATRFCRSFPCNTVSYVGLVAVISYLI
jgi:hypothetical protein